MSKSRGKRSTILAVIVIILILAGMIFVLERGLTRKGPPQRLAETDLAIKGCLFELGIKKDQATIKGHTIQVNAKEKFTRDQLFFAFTPLEKYGKVDIKDIRHIRIVLSGETWEIEFTYPKRELAAVIPPKLFPTRAPTGRMAIIVDDMGLEMQPAEQLASLDADLTFSILPMRPYSQEVARYLHAKGHEVLLHLPMEGNHDKDPGEGAIYMDMTPDHIRTVLYMDMRAVPYISGVNNHMGSKVTPNRDIMMIIENELKKKGLFFIDSLTTNTSVGTDVALEIGLPSGERDIFLDNEQNEAYIMDQLTHLKSIARRHASAIGICHPHPTTIAILMREIPKFADEGIRLERVSTFIKNGRE